jgi:ATP-dependent protease ClpP protease subunit
MRHFKLNVIMTITGILAAFIISGCAGQGMQMEPVKHTMEITVKNTDGKVEVKTPEINIENVLNGKDGMELSGSAFVSGDVLNYYLYSGINVTDLVKLDEDILKVETMMPAIKTLRLFLNSGGGGAFDGLAIADRIEQAKADGWTVIADGSGIIASAAVPIFVVCSERNAAPGTIFMVHEAALWKWPGRESASDIAAQTMLMKILRDRYLGKMVDNTSIPKEEWRRMEKNTTWFNVEQAAGFGMLGSNPNN